jgi:hypothetical protein
MKSHGLEMKGVFGSSDGVDAIQFTDVTGEVTFLTDLDIDGNTQLDGTVKITGGSPLAGKVLYTTDANGTLGWKYQSVPSTKTVIFEKNTAVTGYTLETGHDDSVVYITKGSDEGGETAGTNKSGGTWTQPGHDHGGASSLTGWIALSIAQMPRHRHQPDLGGDSKFLASGAGGSGESGNDFDRSKWTAYACGRYDGGPALSHRHTLGNIDSETTANTWRPYGRNLTRQTKL